MIHGTPAVTNIRLSQSQHQQDRRRDSVKPAGNKKTSAGQKRNHDKPSARCARSKIDEAGQQNEKHRNPKRKAQKLLIGGHMLNKEVDRSVYLAFREDR